MTRKIPEQDWKYLFAIRDDLLQTLCRRINAETMGILREQGLTEHERYLKAFKQIKNADQAISKCFDDWRRSSMHMTLINLCQNKLLTQEHLDHFTNETSDFLLGIMRDMP